MSDKGEITLEGQAVEEILKEARRGKELANELGSLAWQKKHALPNKRFLNNTLVSTLRHSYRKEEKMKDGSHRKYNQHMSRRRMGGRGRFRSTHDNIQDTEPEPDNVDYGEFDAMKYTDNCTNLYIRDSHRKHARMKEMFVEKKEKNGSSESEESFTEEPERPVAENKWKHDKYEGQWQDTGSADENDSDNNGGQQASDVSSSSGEESHKESNNSDDNIDSNSRYEKEFRKLEEIRKQKQIIKEYLKASRDYSKPSTSRDYDSNESNSDSEVSDNDLKPDRASRKSGSEDSSNNSGTESAETHAKRVKLNKITKSKEKGKKKSQKLRKVDGKKLAELISQRSMYADIEELRGKGEVDQPERPRERTDTDKRKHTAILMEDGEFADERGRSRRHMLEKMVHKDNRDNQGRGRKRSFENSFERERQLDDSRDRNRPFDQSSGRGRPFNRSVERERHDPHRSREREGDSFWRGADRLSPERAEHENRPVMKLRRKDDNGDGFWRGSSRERFDRDPRASPRGRGMEHREFQDRDSRERDRYPKEMDHDYLSDEERRPVIYKTIGDEVREEEMQEFHGYDRGGFRGRRPFRGRPPFMRGRFPGRPFRGRGGFMDPGFNPMMPVMNPIYASLMQEFLHESGFGTWLKKRAKKSHKSRRHSTSSSRSSSSRSRSRSHRRSHKYKKRRRRHSSSYSDSSGSRSRSRSRRRSRSRSRRRSYSSRSSRSRSRHRSSRSRSRSYSRSRSRRRSRSRSERSRSHRRRSDSSRSRSHSRSRDDRKRSESKSYQDRTRESKSKSESRRESVNQELSTTTKTTKRTRPSRFRDKSPSQSPSRSPSRSKSVSQPKGIFVPIPETNVEICEEVEEVASSKDESVKLKLKKKSQKHGKTKRKKKSKKPKVPVEAEVNPEEEMVEAYEEPGEIAELGEIEETELVESSGNHLDENLENVSSDNGQEWSSAEEGEL